MYGGVAMISVTTIYTMVVTFGNLWTPTWLDGIFAWLGILGALACGASMTLLI